MSGSKHGERTESIPAAKARNMLMPPISIMPISDMFYDLASMIDCQAEPPQPKPVQGLADNPKRRTGAAGYRGSL